MRLRLLLRKEVGHKKAEHRMRLRLLRKGVAPRARLMRKERRQSNTCMVQMEHGPGDHLCLRSDVGFAYM